MPSMECQPQRRDAADVDLMATALRHCADLLSLRDLASCHIHALAARNLDPHHPGPAQALAIAEVLAAGKHLRNGHPDWYAVLQVEKNSQPDVVRAHFMKLFHLLNPTRNKFPFSGDATGIVMTAWRILSDPAAKAKYDAEVATPATFYTVCPYCYYIFQYEIVYRDHCLRCQSCRRAFHAAEVNAPLPKIVKFVGAGGRLEEGYHCRLACFRLQFQLNPDVSRVKKSGDCPLVNIPSNKEVEGHFCGNNSDGMNGELRIEVPKEEERPRKKMRTKTTAKNTKKIMGRGVGNSVPFPKPEANNGANDGIGSKVGDGSVDEDLQFTFVGNDIFVGCFDEVLEDTVTSPFE